MLKAYKMDTIIQDLDGQVYQDLRIRAALEGRTPGEVLNEAIRGYLLRVAPIPRKASLRVLQPQLYLEGNENLSSEIDVVVYGLKL